MDKLWSTHLVQCGAPQIVTGRVQHVQRRHRSIRLLLLLLLLLMLLLQRSQWIGHQQMMRSGLHRLLRVRGPNDGLLERVWIRDIQFI